MKKNTIKILLVLASLILSASVIHAHEFIIKPVQLNAEAGHKLPFSVVSAHVFMISEEVEPIDQVEISLISGDKKNRLGTSPK